MKFLSILVLSLFQFSKQKIIEQDASYFKAHLILSVVALYNGESAGATQNYERMAETGARGESLANIGIADIALFEGRYADAADSLSGGIAKDEADGNERGVGTKKVALAQARVALGAAW